MTLWFEPGPGKDKHKQKPLILAQQHKHFHLSYNDCDSKKGKINNKSDYVFSVLTK